MAARNAKSDKGGTAEEALHEYFLLTGAFVLRGVPVRSGLEDVTDVDLWVYSRTNSFARHISIVDIKNKRRGKAFERAVWVKGLQSLLGADQAIIATQGAKPEVYDFASTLDVRVISGTLFKSLIKKYSTTNTRLTAEIIDQEWKSTRISRANLKAIMDEEKSHISAGMSFAALNSWLDKAGELLKLSVERERKPGPITRAAYLTCALVAIGADFISREQALSEASVRKDFFRNGLLFGNADSSSGKSYTNFTETMVTEYADPTGALAAQIRSGFEKAVSNMPLQGLVEFFSRANSSAELYKGAIRLEAECYASEITHPSKLNSIEAKTIIGLISDYAGIPRRDILGEKASEIHDNGKLL